MTSIPINNLEEFFANMRRGQEYDQENRAEPQKTLTWGSKWVRFLPHGGIVGNDTLVIFGDVTTREALAEEELRAGSPEGEIEYLLTHRDRQMINGFLSSMCYSVLLLGGEQSTVHQAWVWPIDDATFEAAKAADWDVAQMPEEARQIVTTAFAGFVAHLAHLDLEGDND